MQVKHDEKQARERQEEGGSRTKNRQTDDEWRENTGLNTPGLIHLK